MAMDITPTTNLLASLRGEQFRPKILVCEAIDNSLDAGASRVDITIDGTAICFKDNGCGVTKKNLPALFTLGAHAELATTRLGRFGVGLTSQSVCAGDILTVESISADGSVSAQVNWKQIHSSGIWNTPDPRWKPCVVGAKTGTKIIIESLRTASKRDFDSLAEEIASVFHPAIETGTIITLNGNPIECLHEPDMTDVVEREIFLSGGRSASLKAGLLISRSKHHGVNVGYKHRIIMPKSALGCDGYSGINKMHCRLQIHGPWRLSKFKDDLANYEECEELEEAVHEILKPLLEKCNAASMDARIDNILMMANEGLGSFSAARPQRTGVKKNKSDKVTKPGIVDRDKANDGGPAKANTQPKDRLLITFDASAEEHGIGYFQRASGRSPHRVNLSKDHREIADLLALRDEEQIAGKIRLLAIAFYCEAMPATLFLQGTFGQRIAQLLAKQHTSENAPQEATAI